MRLHRPRCALRSGGASPERQRSWDLRVRSSKWGWEEIPPLRQNVGLGRWGGSYFFLGGKTGNFCGCCKTAGCGVLAAGCNGASAKEPFALKVFREYPSCGSGVLVCIRETLNSIKLISAFRSCGSVQRTAPSLGRKEPKSKAGRSCEISISAPIGRVGAAGTLLAMLGVPVSPAHGRGDPALPNPGKTVMRLLGASSFWCRALC